MQHIRTAEIRDLPALTTLDHAVFGDKPYPGFFFRKALELWPEFLLIAENDAGELQGYLLAAPATEPTVAWILSLAVDNAARGKSIGKSLVRAAIEAMHRKSVAVARLTTHPDNTAVSLYEKLGFRVIGANPDYFQDGEPRISLVLQP